MNYTKKFSSVIILALFWVVVSGVAYAESSAEVAFSGIVKKVKPDKNKVSIKDPESKKRFTVIVEEKTKLTGYESVGDVKKGDPVQGKYLVTPDGKYIATELGRK
jgi:hypothetical protein